MKSHRFLTHCMSTPWAMEPTAMSLYAAMLVKGYAQRDGLVAIDDRAFEPQAAARPNSETRKGSIAVINVFGSIVQRASQLGPCEGGTSTEEIGAALQMALADETVAQILMQFDTPGGSVFGVSELGGAILAGRSQKPIIGFANSMSASAGYWLMSQCSEVYCTPGGMVGSIGVYGAHQDISKALEESGVNITLVSAGKYKTEGSPYMPLDPEAKASMQASIDSYYNMFTKAVAKGRGVGIDEVRNGMGEGRCLQADAAQAAGMIDGVMTFNDVVKKMSRSQPQRSARSAMSAARNELALLA